MMNYSEALEQQVAMLRDWQIATTDGMQPFVVFLERAETYFWSAELVPMLEVSAKTYPGVILRRDWLPSTSGFLYFGRPIRIPPPKENDELHGEDDGDVHGLMWAASGDEGLAVLFLSPCLKHAGRHLAPMWLVTVPWDKAIVNSPELWIEDARSQMTMMVFTSAVSFLQQRVLAAPQQRAERHAAKRAAREGWTHEPLIRVVQLRRTERQGYHLREDSESVDWSCQWVVRGHWRQQFFPASKEHRPLWITPYVKGPEDKPLKVPRATVFAVVR